MHNGKTISLKEIMFEVLRNPMVKDLSFEDAASFAIRCLRLINTPLIFIDKVSKPLIDIQEFKGGLPLDLIKIRGARVIQNKNNHDYDSIPLTYATDIFHKALECNDLYNEESERNCNETGYIDYRNEYTYTVQKNRIFTSFENGKVELSYQALQTDEDGFPMIPDNEKIKEAIKYYILFQYMEPLFMMGKISDKAFQYIEQQYNWYVGAAQSSSKLNNMDQLEATMNSINRLLIEDQAYNNHYKGMGKRERLRRYN